MIEILTPSRGDINIRTCGDLLGLVGYSQSEGLELQFLPVEGTYLVSMRENLLQKAIEDGATHALWVDSDMRFPINALERLLAHGHPFVAANYQSRTQGAVPVASIEDQKVSSAGKSGLQEVHAVGFGLALMELAPVAKLERPRFRMPWSKDQSEWIGEDVWICAYMRANGIKVLIDHDLSQEVFHIGSTELAVV